MMVSRHLFRESAYEYQYQLYQHCSVSLGVFLKPLLLFVDEICDSC
jgi:hypothetical protein